MNVDVSRGVPKIAGERGVRVHGCFTYICSKCGKGINMYLEMGVEEKCNKRLMPRYKSGKEHKPTPFIIQCPSCKELAMEHKKTSYIPYPIIINPKNYSYFAYGKDGCATTCIAPKDKNKEGTDNE